MEPNIGSDSSSWSSRVATIRIRCLWTFTMCICSIGQKWGWYGSL